MSLEKYLKYKNKYLALKNKLLNVQKGGSDKDVKKALEESLKTHEEDEQIRNAMVESLKQGNSGGISSPVPKFKVVPNSGIVYDEKGNQIMSNQCFWISILDYLLANPGINDRNIKSVKELRTLVGLKEDTEHIMVDENDPVFKEAVDNLNRIFNLQIIIHFIHSNGHPIILQDEITHVSRPVIRILNEQGVNKVNITQQGLNHFQYISEIKSVKSVEVGSTGVLIGEKLVFGEKYERFADIDLMIKIYEEELKNAKVEIDKLFKLKIDDDKTIKSTIDLSRMTEANRLISLTDDINKKIAELIKEQKELVSFDVSLFQFIYNQIKKFIKKKSN